MFFSLTYQIYHYLQDPKIVFKNKFGEGPNHAWEKFAYNEKYSKHFGTPMGSYQTVFTGTFKTSYELHKFPYDSQKLEITVSSNRTTDQILFKPNPTAPSGAVDVNKFVIADMWELKLNKSKKRIKYDLTNSEFGSRALQHDQGREGSRPVIESSFIAKRKPGFYEVNILLLNFIIVILAFTAYGLSINDVSDRLGIVMTLMLTSVAFKTYVADQLPKNNYLTFLDKYLLVGIFLLTVMACECFLVNIFVSDDQEFMVDRWFGIVLMSGWILGNIVVFAGQLSRCCSVQDVEEVRKKKATPEQKAKKRDLDSKQLENSVIAIDLELKEESKVAANSDRDSKKEK